MSRIAFFLVMTSDMKEIRVELRGTMGGKHHSLIDDDEEEEDDEDVYIFIPNSFFHIIIEKQYVHQKLVNGTEIRLHDL